jgi:hypothetical protein
VKCQFSHKIVIPTGVQRSGGTCCSVDPMNQYPMKAPPSTCHPEEPTCLRQVKGAMNSTGRRALDGCPMFAPANVGRKRRAKPHPTLLGCPRYGCSLGAKSRDLLFRRSHEPIPNESTTLHLSSRAKPRDLQFPRSLPPIPNGSATLPFVIPRSRLACVKLREQ